MPPYNYHIHIICYSITLSSLDIDISIHNLIPPTAIINEYKSANLYGHIEEHSWWPQSTRDHWWGTTRHSLVWGDVCVMSRSVWYRGDLSDMPQFSIILIPEYGISSTAPSWSNKDTAFLSRCVKSPHFLECKYGATKDEESTWPNFVSMGNALVEQLIAWSADNQVRKLPCFDSMGISDISY